MVEVSFSLRSIITINHEYKVLQFTIEMAVRFRRSEHKVLKDYLNNVYFHHFGWLVACVERALFSSMPRWRGRCEFCHFDSELSELSAGGGGALPGTVDGAVSPKICSFSWCS